VGFFDFLKSDKLKNNLDPDRPWEVLKVATQYAKKQEYDTAIQILRGAFDEMARRGDPYELDARLRLPRYLQKAGRNDEAWGELNKLTHEFGFKVGDPYFNFFRIHDAMRIFLQREKKFDWAVCHAAWSHLDHIMALSGDPYSSDKLREFCSMSFITQKMRPHLKKAKAESLSSEVCGIIKKHAEKLRKADAAYMVKEIGDLLRERNETTKQKGGLNETG